MDKKSITATLQALATDNMQRSKAARLRDVFDDVEQALSAGVSRTLIVETLAGMGLLYTLKGFDSAMRRNRLRNSAADKAAKPPIDAPSGNGMGLPMPRHLGPGGSHKPADLDQIISSKPNLSALAKLAKRKSV